MADVSALSTGSGTPPRSPASLAGTTSSRTAGSPASLSNLQPDLLRTLTKFNHRGKSDMAVSRKLDFDDVQPTKVDGKQLFQLLDQHADKELFKTDLTQLFDLYANKATKFSWAT